MIFIVDPALFTESSKLFGTLLLKMLPILALVFVLMAAIGYFLNAKNLALHTKGKKGLKTWGIAILGGIVSSGPSYMWYPLLAEIRKKGASNGFLACFLYSRAIKIPLIPLMITYFGMLYVIILTIVMILISVVQGILIDFMIKEKGNE